MFNNIGGKIKTLAKVVCWIGIIACIITGIVLMATDDDLILVGILTAVVGSLLSWVSSFVLYGFGQLVENSDVIVSQRNVLPNQAGDTAFHDETFVTEGMTQLARTTTPLKPINYKCPVCRKMALYGDATCSKCGQSLKWDD